MNQDTMTREFYNKYGRREWERLDRSPYDRLNFLLHMDFVKEFCTQGIKLIDVGCGSGRYSIEFARIGCEVSLFDISDEQLMIAEKVLGDFNLKNRLQEVIRGSISDMSVIEDDTYEVTVCYGAPLNYLFDDYKKGIEELYRITKPGGSVAVSVVGRIGVFRALLGREEFDSVGFFGNPEYWKIDEVLCTGNLVELPEVEHPPRHFFSARELEQLFKEVGFKDIELGSSPSIMCGMRDEADKLCENEVAWKKVIDIEMKTYKRRELADSGEFLMLRARK